MASRVYILTLVCPDRVGIVAGVTGMIASHGGNILDLRQYSDEGTKTFFMRLAIDADTLGMSIDEFTRHFEPLAAQYQMTWKLHDSSRPRRVVILVSRTDHCLAELLYRRNAGEYHIEIPCVISNHEKLRPLVEANGITFHYVPMTSETRDGAFREIERLYREAGGEVMVLARFMQVLPDWLCERYYGNIINIHHGLLPSFTGARPYHQAYEKGVKTIGATCHYVTAELDQGPIIEQDVYRISHAHSVEHLIQIGRDIEKLVLARGLRWHLEDRVLLDGRRTIVFSEGGN